MVRVLGRRAVSGAITGMFVVLIFVAAISTLLAYNTSQDRYNQAVSERNQREWERLNEKIIISSAERVEEDGTLNATIQNVGAVTAHLVGLWLSAYDIRGEPQWQRQYSIDIWVNPGETRTNFGQDIYSYTLIKPSQISETSSIQLPVKNWIYVIKTVSDRGNTATYILQPPEEKEPEKPPPPVAYVYGSMKIRYKGSATRPDSDPNGWCNPWVAWDIIASAKIDDNKVQIKINITNTCGHDVTFRYGSVVYQCSDKQGNKQLYLGGEMAAPVFIRNGETKEIIFWLNYNNENTKPNTPFVYVGLAAFSTSETPAIDFLSGAIMLDGLLVPY